MLIFELQNYNNFSDIINVIRSIVKIEYGPSKYKDFTYIGNQENHIRIYSVNNFTYIQVLLRRFVYEDFFYNPGDPNDSNNKDNWWGYIHDNLQLVIKCFRDWVDALKPVMGIVSPYPVILTTKLMPYKDEVSNILYSKIIENPCKSMVAIYPTQNPSLLSSTLIRLLREPLPFLMDDISIITNKEPLKTPKDFIEELSKKCKINYEDNLAILNV
ncbi:MAG: hypothetical protein ACP5NY_07875 [Thermocladium sp.]